MLREGLHLLLWCDTGMPIPTYLRSLNIFSVELTTVNYGGNGINIIPQQWELYPYVSDFPAYQLH